MENILLELIDIRSIRQNCAQWFLLRQFSITGTIDGIIRLAKIEFRNAVDFYQLINFGDDMSVDELLKLLVKR